MAAALWPSVSVAVTVKAWTPRVEVSIATPVATGPEQPAVPAFSVPPLAPGVHVYAAVTVAPSAYVAPSPGEVIVADGGPSAGGKTEATPTGENAPVTKSWVIVAPSSVALPIRLPVRSAQ